MLNKINPRIFWPVFAAILLSVFVSACAEQATPTFIVPTQDNSPTYTAAVQTVSAQLTLNAQAGGEQPTATQPAPDQPQLPTATAVSGGEQPTSTQPAPTPTNTPWSPTPTSKPPKPTQPAPAPTQAPAASCNKAALISEIDNPDSSAIEVRTTFYKTWRIKNTGTCSWDDDYMLVLTSGDDLGTGKYVDWKWGKVKPGQQVDITLGFQIPHVSGVVKNTFKILPPSGAKFGVTNASGVEKPLVMEIDTFKPSVIAYDFTKQAPYAQWRNTTTVLTFGSLKNDSLGIAAFGLNLRLEDALTYARALMTFPQKISDGSIWGVYPAYQVQKGDRFKAQIGLRAPCTDGKVTFKVSYTDYSSLLATNSTLGEWEKQCDGELETVDVKLTNLVGKNIQFMLSVNTHGSPKNDKAIWVFPRIER